jgi:hypothetical protein
MAKSIRDLNPIDAVDVSTLFEGVTGEPDPAGILARKVTAAKLETFIGRRGDNGVVEMLLDEKVAAEAARIDALLNQESEQAEQELEAEEERAQSAEEALAEAKANKIASPRSKTLETALIGESVGSITFDVSKMPVPPLPDMAGSIVFADTSRFNQLQDGTFVYVSAAGTTTVIYTPGTGWLQEGLDAGTSYIISKEKAAGAAWRLAVFFKNGFDLVDVNAVAQAAYETASMAAEQFMAEDHRDDMQDALIAALQADDVPLPEAAGRYVLYVDDEGIASFVPETVNTSADAKGKKK